MTLKIAPEIHPSKKKSRRQTYKRKRTLFAIKTTDSNATASEDTTVTTPDTVQMDSFLLYNYRRRKYLVMSVIDNHVTVSAFAHTFKPH